MIMRKMKYMLACILAISACGPQDEPAKETTPLSVDVRTLEFGEEGGEKTFNVTASEQLYLVPGDASWISVSKGAKGTDDKTAVTVKVKANPDEQDRSSNISVVAGEEKQYVDIKQKGKVVEPEPVPVPGDNAAWRMAERLGMGWNLGNHFDAHSNGVAGETVWGNDPATQNTFTKVKAAGFTTVRIPVTWLGHFGEAPDYKIEDAWIDRVAEVVGYAEKAGLNVIINMHHDGADSQHWLNISLAAINPEINRQIKEQIAAMWGQIAAKFADKGDFLIFEAFNEIQDGGWGSGANKTDGGKQYKCMNEWNQTFVDAVRATGGNNADRILGVPAYCTNVDIALESFVMPTDKVKDRLMLSVHCYDPYHYTISAECSEWGHTAAKDKKVAGDNEADLKKVFDKLYANYVSKGIPVYLGEFGCVNRNTAREQAFQQYYLKYYAKLCRMYGIPALIWDNGAEGGGYESHAFINHGTGAYCSTEAKKAIEAVIGSYNNDSSEYTLEYIYANAPK